MPTDIDRLLRYRDDTVLLIILADVPLDFSQWKRPAESC
jgi:hypothetical protein